MSDTKNKELVSKAIKMIKDHNIKFEDMNEIDKFKHSKYILSDLLNILTQVNFDDNNSDEHLYDYMLSNTDDFSLTLNYANKCVSFDELSIILRDRNCGNYCLNYFISVSDVIENLKMNKNYNKILLNNNILCDEGFENIIENLKNYESLQILDISSNLISDIGLRCIVKILDLPNLIRVIIKDNYKPSKETLQILRNDIKIIY